MIQPLRTAHRRVFAVWAVLLPAIFLTGLGARHSRPGAAGEVLQLPSSATLVAKSDKLWKRHATRSKFYRDARHPGGLYVVLQPLQGVSEPDLLLYWSADEAQGDTLPVGAQLLGAFVAREAFALPPDAKPGSHLILYSLAHQARVDTATVETLP